MLQAVTAADADTSPLGPAEGTAVGSTQVPCPDSPWGLEVRWGVLMDGSVGQWPRASLHRAVAQTPFLDDLSWPSP